jgi:hypothetical protein
MMSAMSGTGSTTTLEHELVHVVAGRRAVGDLPAIATAALSAGRDTPGLRELAGAPQWDTDGLRALLRTAMAEIKLAASPWEAFTAVVREDIDDFREGRVGPGELGVRVEVLWRQLAGRRGADRPGRETADAVTRIVGELEFLRWAYAEEEWTDAGEPVVARLEAVLAQPT